MILIEVEQCQSWLFLKRLSTEGSNRWRILINEKLSEVLSYESIKVRN